MMRIHLNVIGKPDSPWVDALRAVAADRLSVVTTAIPVQGAAFWQYLCRDHFGGALTAGWTGEAGSSISADGAETWQFEDESGALLLAPFCGGGQWQREPYSMMLRLIAERGGKRAMLAEACIGTRGSYRELLDQLVRTAVILLAKALSGTPQEAEPDAGEAAVGAGGAGARALFGGALRRQILRNSRRLAMESWAVGVAGRPIGQIITSGELGKVAWFGWDDRQGYLADPFPWPGRGDRFLCERYSNARGSGDLVCVDTADVSRQVRIDLPETRHLSYPGAWLEEDGSLLLMPESGASRRTVIYRLEDEGRAVPWVTVAEGCGMADPTLFRKDGLCWIAYTDTDIGLHDNLCLMYADRPEGPWRRHPANPVKLDIRSSRPAGPLFEHDGQWYRPAQNCAADYGAALAINRIQLLSKSHYREELVTMLRPDPAGAYPHGLHTLSVWGDRVLVDGKCWRRHPHMIVEKILKRLRGARDS